MQFYCNTDIISSSDFLLKLQMEKSRGKRLAQRREIQLEEFIDWSILSYEDNVMSDEDGAMEPAARWIYKK